MTFSHTELDVGAKKPFTLLHITDTHLTFISEEDNDQIKGVSAKRQEKYPHSEAFLETVKSVAKEKNAVVIHTGDMTDCISHNNMKYIKAFTDEVDCQFTVGNHDFRTFLGTGYDCDASRDENRERINALYHNDICFSSRIINGVNLVGIDNVYYQFYPYQLERLKEEVKKGYPIILTVHVPLYEESLYHLIVQGERLYASQIAVPEEMMQNYPEKRYIQQRATDFTREMVAFIENEPSVKAILTGHVHKSFESLVAGRIPQIVTGLYELREITVK